MDLPLCGEPGRSALQDIRARNARIERAGQSDDLVARLELQTEEEDEEDEEKKRLDEEDEKLVQAVFSKVSVPPTASGSGEASNVVALKRKANVGDSEPALEKLLSESARTLIASKSSLAAKKRKTDGKLGIKIVKKKKKGV